MCGCTLVSSACGFREELRAALHFWGAYSLATDAFLVCQQPKMKAENSEAVDIIT